MERISTLSIVTEASFYSFVNSKIPGRSRESLNNDYGFQTKTHHHPKPDRDRLMRI